jgi:hypothetical protein
MSSLPYSDLEDTAPVAIPDDKPIVFLEQDAEIRDQKFVCLSYLTQDDVRKREDIFHMENAMNKSGKDLDDVLTQLQEKHSDDDYIFNTVRERYNYIFENDYSDQYKFFVAHNPNHEETFYNNNGSHVCAYSIKIHKAFANENEAKMFSKMMHQKNPAFPIFVAPVGKWIPWSPNVKDMEDEDKATASIDELLSKYAELREQTNRDYDNRTSKLIEANKDENKKRKIEIEKQKALDDKEEKENIIEDETKDEESKDEESKDEESKDEESKDEESKDEESKDYKIVIQNDDPDIVGQKFVSVSMIIPKNIVEKKEKYFMKKFVMSIVEDFKEIIGTLEKKYKKESDIFKTFKKSNENMFKDETKFVSSHFGSVKKDYDTVNEEYVKSHELSHSFNLIKIRGVFESIDTANEYSSKLNKNDKHVNIYTGSVGCWGKCTFVNPDEISQQEYGKDDVNELMQGYKENRKGVDEVYDSETKAIVEERLANDEIKNRKFMELVEDDPKKKEEKVEEKVKEKEEEKDHEYKNENRIEEEFEAKSNTVFVNEDPWMQNKQREKEKEGKDKSD